MQDRKQNFYTEDYINGLKFIAKATGVSKISSYLFLLDDLLVEGYERVGYSIIEVPKTSVEERVNFILSKTNNI